MYLSAICSRRGGNWNIIAAVRWHEAIEKGKIACLVIGLSLKFCFCNSSLLLFFFHLSPVEKICENKALFI